MIKKMSVLIGAAAFALASECGAAFVFTNVKDKPVVQVKTKTISNEAESLLPAAKNGNSFGTTNLTARKSTKQNGCAANPSGAKTSPHSRTILKGSK